jgi:hypothetical protein
MNEPLTALKARYSIVQAWPNLGLAGEPAKICRSPFPSDHKNGDAHPSFSVFADGTRWKNQANGEGGDVFDLVMKARACDMAAAVAWVRERLGIGREPVALAASRSTGGTPWPELRPGTAEECARLAKLRHLAPEAVQFATARGFLYFGTLWRHSFWAVTDQRRKLVEFRRLDGAPWSAFGRLAERKSHCLGSGKDWPVGTLEAAPANAVAWLEGAPDFLAFWHFAFVEGKTRASRRWRCSARQIIVSLVMHWRGFTGNTSCCILISTTPAALRRRRGRGSYGARGPWCRRSTSRVSRKTTAPSGRT